MTNVIKMDSYKLNENEQLVHVALSALTFQVRGLVDAVEHGDWNVADLIIKEAMEDIELMAKKVRRLKNPSKYNIFRLSGKPNVIMGQLTAMAMQYGDIKVQDLLEDMKEWQA